MTTNTLKTLRAGQTIRIINPQWVPGGAGEPFVHGSEHVVLEVEQVGPWPIRVGTEDVCGALAPHECKVVKDVVTEPTAPMTKAVLDYMRTKGALTSMEAQGVLRCRQLPARVLELKRLGHKITTKIKYDPTGQKYARYHLQALVA